MKVALVNEAEDLVQVMWRTLLSTGEHRVAWTASDGMSAVRLAMADPPDLILMGLLRRGVDSVEATRRIMARAPCPIVIVTADPDQNHARVFEAMGAGALDALNAPDLLGADPGSAMNALLAKIDTIRRLTGASGHGAVRSLAGTAAHKLPRRPVLVAMGASAGGPAALATILGRWSAGFPGAVVVVQHVDPQFAPSLADWLGSQTKLTVRLARERDQPQAGKVLLAGGRGHLVLDNLGRLGYVQRSREGPCEPSVDAFFRSIAKHWRGEVIAVLLTGMGRDGAMGLQLLRKARHDTMAQDEASSAVYGMPKAAAELDAAGEVLPLGRIAQRITMKLARLTKP